MIEEDAARICANLHCPNSHLAMESLTGPKEVRWLTPYESESDRQRVANGYASNHALAFRGGPPPGAGGVNAERE